MCKNLCISPFSPPPASPSVDASSSTQLCPRPSVRNGRVESDLDSGEEVDNDKEVFVGVASCTDGFHLVGASRIKCIRGVWSSEMPVCTSELVPTSAVDLHCT